MEDKLIAYGGQAVIEGVMMRGRKTYAVAMRAPNGTIETRVEQLGGIYKSRVVKIPFLRGLRLHPTPEAALRLLFWIILR